MTGGDDANDSGRVTTREFYDALMRQNLVQIEMERRIVGKLDKIAECLPGVKNQVDTNKEEIKQLRTKSNVNDVAVAIAAAIASAIAAVIGAAK